MLTTFKICSRQLLVIASMAMFFATCRKPKNCVQTGNSFAFGVEATPNRDSISIGDTIWIQVNEPTTLNDLVTNRPVDFSRAVNLGTNIGFQKIVGTLPQIVNSANDFSFLIQSGIETTNPNPQLFREYLVIEENARYLLRIGVIPKSPGIFRINVGNAANVYRKDDQCSKANIAFNFKNTDQHFYLYPGGTNIPPGGNNYYFKVQ